MTFDVLNQPLDCSGWAEPAAESGFAAYWDRELFGIEIPPWRHNVVRWIEQAWHAGDGRPIVIGDMGCGAALYARHLLAAGIPFEYHGYDHNVGVLEAACHRWEFLPYENVYLHQFDARAAKWPIADESLDVILWDTTLRFCNNVETALAESFRVARQWVLLARTPLEARTWRESVSYYGMATPSPNWHFDEAFFRAQTQQHEWFFTPRAGDEELQILSRRPLPRDVAIRPASNHARAFHAAYVRERVARLFERHPGLWAIYGAGSHSRWLLSTLPIETRSRISVVLDDAAQPAGAIHGIPILSPGSGDGQGEVRLSRIVAVLLSSDTIESALRRAASRNLPPGTPIYSLYDDLTPGPYDKGFSTPAAVTTASP